MSQLCKKVIKETWMKTISVSSKPTRIKVLSLILKTCCNKETSTHIHLKVVTRHWSRGLKIVLSIQRPHLHFNWYVSLEIKPVYTEAKEKWNSHETQKRPWNEQLFSSPVRQKSKQRVLCLPENRLRRASETLKVHLQPHRELTSYQILYTNQYVAIKPFSSCEFSLLSVLASNVSS